MNIPFGDLKRHYDALRDPIDRATQEVYSSGWFVLGQQVQRFEASFAAYCGAAHGVGVGSGTEAIHLALLACGIQPGDEVITVSNTCVPTLSAISFAGAVPVFVDIDPATYTIDPARIEARITPNTKAIVPVHLYGQCADMDPILNLAATYGLKVVEDCAQATGAKYKGRMAGTMGHAGAFSFYPSKNLGAFGDGGLVLTNDAELADTVKKLRNYGQEKRYYHAIKGFNSRLDELQAAILSAKLPYLDQWNQRRRQIADRYHQALASTGIVCPLEAVDRDHVYHLYVIRVPEREAFQAALTAKSIGTIIHYPVPVHLQAAYSEYRQQGEFLPVTENLKDQIISLPLYPELTDAEVDTVINAVIEVVNNSIPATAMTRV
jgi:dTDP-4-amino-4,6-dideoxygalactose transaminase